MAAARGVDGGDGTRGGWRGGPWRGGRAAPAWTAHWPTAGIGLELTTAEAPAPVPSIPCSDIRARPSRAGYLCAERNLNWRETHAARDHHHR